MCAWPTRCLASTHAARSPAATARCSHFKVQYMDGLRGAFIIDDPSATQYPADTFVTVADWYHQLASVLLQVC